MSRHSLTHPPCHVSAPSQAVLELENVWLRIPVHTPGSRTLKRTLLRSVTGGHLSRTSHGKTEVEALRDISCTISQGERIGLLGHNGAGKSSFLRLVSGIYHPSSGQLRRHCKVFPMIQKSFITSPDLSGADAAKGHYLLQHGNLGGFSSYLEDVANFSGIGDFIHLPMKSYSEGMRARLLFSMLTATHHECLALDEGFGAADANFFSKAQKRLENFIASTGTLLLASHSDELLSQFCTRGLVFEEGRIIFDGPLDQALANYHTTCP